MLPLHPLQPLPAVRTPPATVYRPRQPLESDLHRLLREHFADLRGVYRAHKEHCRQYPRPADPDLFGGVARNFQVFEPRDFLAELTQHIPNQGEHLIRYYGGYSNKARTGSSIADGGGTEEPGPRADRAPGRPPDADGASGVGAAHAPMPGIPRMPAASSFDGFALALSIEYRH